MCVCGVLVICRVSILCLLQTEPSSEPFVVVQPEDPPDDSPHEEEDEADEEKRDSIHPDQVNCANHSVCACYGFGSGQNTGYQKCSFSLKENLP